MGSSLHRIACEHSFDQLGYHCVWRIGAKSSDGMKRDVLLRINEVWKESAICPHAGMAQTPDRRLARFIISETHTIAGNAIKFRRSET